MKRFFQYLLLFLLVCSAAQNSGKYNSNGTNGNTVVITSHPTDLHLCPNNNAVFRVSATGDVMGYQWRRNGDNLPNDEVYTGSNTSTLTILFAGAGEADTYDCVVYDSSEVATTSNSATLTISSSAPTITTHPSDQQIPSGSAAKFTVKPSGPGPFTYQWFWGETLLSDGGSISGATSNELKVSPAYAINEGSYFCKVTNCGGSVTSNGATLSIQSEVVGNREPVIEAMNDQSINEDNNLTVTVTFSDADANDTHTISLACDNTNISVGNLSGHTSGSTFRITPADNYSGSGEVTVTVKDNSGAVNDTDTEKFKITVNEVNDYPVIINNTGATVNEGGSFVLSTNEISAHDIDGDDSYINFRIDTVPDFGCLLKGGDDTVNAGAQFSQSDIITGLISYSHFGGEDSSDHFTYSVGESGVFNQNADFLISITAKNDKPTIAEIPQIEFPEDGEYTLTIAALSQYVTDPDTAPEAFQFAFDHFTNVSIDNSIAGTVIFSAPENWFGIDSASVSVSDGELSDSTTILVKVTSVNDQPVLSGLPAQLEFYSNENSELCIWDYVSDVETPDSLLNIGSDTGSDSVYASLNSETGCVVISCNSSYSGTSTLTISVTDEEGAEASGQININIIDITGIDEFDSEKPESFDLKQNYPNPFNPMTIVSYQLPEAANVKISVYNVLGNKVTKLVDEEKSAGIYNVHFDGSQLASGTYFCRMQAGDFTKVIKMLLIK